ncbi:MAG: cytochrome c-type biogenesis protein [Pseudomonadota bacterium]
MRYWLAFVLLPLLMAFEEPLEDPSAEARAQRLMQEIRCVACENEPISQSSAEIAGTMRVRVREMVSDGASDADVRAWFESRYGEFVLFRPSTRGMSGLILWALPFTILLLGSVGIVLMRLSGEGSESVEPVEPESFDHDNGTTL